MLTMYSPCISMSSRWLRATTVAAGTGEEAMTGTRQADKETTAEATTAAPAVHLAGTIGVVAVVLASTNELRRHLTMTRHRRFAECEGTTTVTPKQAPLADRVDGEERSRRLRPPARRRTGAAAVTGEESVRVGALTTTTGREETVAGTPRTVAMMMVVVVVGTVTAAAWPRPTR